MGDSTSALMKLRPVTFLYKPEYDKGERTLQYGLIAEEVAKVYPELVAYDNDGQPYTVRYQYLSTMLLNEVQKQYRRAEAEAKVITVQQDEIEAQHQQMEAQQQQINPYRSRTRNFSSACRGLRHYSGRRSRSPKPRHPAPELLTAPDKHLDSEFEVVSETCVDEQQPTIHAARLEVTLITNDYPSAAYSGGWRDGVKACRGKGVLG